MRVFYLRSIVNIATVGIVPSTEGMTADVLVRELPLRRQALISGHGLRILRQEASSVSQTCFLERQNVHARSTIGKRRFIVVSPSLENEVKNEILRK